jgi:hypothetical protein
VLGDARDPSFSLFFSLSLLLREREKGGMPLAAGRDLGTAGGEKLSVNGEISGHFGDGVCSKINNLAEKIASIPGFYALPVPCQAANLYRPPPWALPVALKGRRGRPAADRRRRDPKRHVDINLI